MIVVYVVFNNLYMELSLKAENIVFFNEFVWAWFKQPNNSITINYLAFSKYFESSIFEINI